MACFNLNLPLSLRGIFHKFFLLTLNCLQQYLLTEMSSTFHADVKKTQKDHYSLQQVLHSNILGMLVHVKKSVQFFVCSFSKIHYSATIWAKIKPSAHPREYPINFNISLFFTFFSVMARPIFSFLNKPLKSQKMYAI